MISIFEIFYIPIVSSLAQTLATKIHTSKMLRLHISGAKIEKDNITIIGNDNKVFGNDCNVIGNGNFIYGTNCDILGNGNCPQSKRAVMSQSQLLQAGC